MSTEGDSLYTYYPNTRFARFTGVVSRADGSAFGRGPDVTALWA